MQWRHRQPVRSFSGLIGLVMGVVLVGVGCSTEAPAPSAVVDEPAVVVTPPSPGPPPRPVVTPAPSAPPARSTAPDLLRSVAVIGASASAGMGAQMAIDRDGAIVMTPTNLTSILRATLAAPDATIHDFATPFFFQAPRQNGLVALQRAREKDATLIVAVDFLFWFAYADLRYVPDSDRERVRLEGLRVGLEQLETVDVPVLVGNIPNMAPAAGLMLRESQIPSPEVLARLNQTIEAWAEARHEVTVLPLATLIESIYARRPLTIGGIELNAEETSQLLMRDRLHPTPSGLIALGQLVTDALSVPPLDVPTDMLRLERDSVIRILRDADPPGDQR